jgi:small neutral amino acid transporter SnatA (MarC family)
MYWSVIGVTFVTLLVIMDPIGASPIFVALTRGFSPHERRRAALRAAAAAGAVVVLFAVTGDAILRYVSVSIHSVSIAGGLLLLLLSLEMLRGIDFDSSPGRRSSRDRARSPRRWCSRGNMHRRRGGSRSCSASSPRSR